MNKMKVKGMARKMGRALERNRDAGKKMQGQNVKGTGQNANKGVFKEMKGAETAVKWK